MARGDSRDFGELREIRLPRNPGRLIRLAVLVVAAVVIGVTSFFQVDPEEIGVITRFGAYVRTAEPGLHSKFPFGVERVTKVPIQRQLKEEFGFRTLVASVRTRYSPQQWDEESLMLTGDLNAADVEWVVQYRIVDPYKYLFRVRNMQETFRHMSEAVMRKIVGDRTVSEVLTVGRQEIATTAETELQDLCERYETGIRVDQVVLQDVNPPEEVKPSFNEVNEAQQEREKLINEALAEYNRVIPKARGEALQTITEAEGYYVDRINRARGDSARFASLFSAYSRAPEVTRKRIFLETMGAILPTVGRKIILDEDMKGVVPLLGLDGTPSPIGKEADK
jgi:membrane protease subunit HflK